MNRTQGAAFRKTLLLGSLLSALIAFGSALGQTLPDGWEFRFSLDGSEEARELSICLAASDDGNRQATVHLGGTGTNSQISLDWLIRHGAKLLAEESAGPIEIGGHEVRIQKRRHRRPQDDAFLIGSKTGNYRQTFITRRSRFHDILNWARKHESDLRAFEVAVVDRLDSGGDLTETSKIEISPLSYSALATMKLTIGGEEAWAELTGDRNGWDDSRIWLSRVNWPVELIDSIQRVGQVAKAGKLTRQSVSKSNAVADIVGFPETGDVIVRLREMNDAIPRRSLRLAPSELLHIDRIIAGRVRAHKAMEQLSEVLKRDFGPF